MRKLGASHKITPSAIHQIRRRIGIPCHERPVCEQPAQLADRRGLTPLFHTNMTPYGEIQLRPDLTDLPTA
ncbi:MAG: transposase Tn3 family protein [Nonomuraea muscovyensis]|nr:transposase Tn3 family protein [Nonomuraea muscovyensis]